VAGRDLSQAQRILRGLLDERPETTQRLRALWALYASGGLDENALIGLLDDRDESIRGWATRLLCDRGNPSAAAIERFTSMAQTDSSPRVRLNLSSAMQRIPLQDRWPLAESLAEAVFDSKDLMLPLMIWYGLEPLAGSNPARAADLCARTKNPLLRNDLARRIVTEDAKTGLTALLPVIQRSPDKVRRDMLSGTLDALRGRKQVPRPEGWGGAFAGLLTTSDPDVLEQTLLLALALGETKAIAALRLSLADRGTPLDIRKRALTALVERRVPGLSQELHTLLDDHSLRGAAIRALAAYQDADTPRTILSRYQTLSESERDDAIATLSARPSWALALLAAVAMKTVPRQDLNATIARQLQALGDPQVAKRLEAVWGTVRPTSTEKTSLMAKYRGILGDDNQPGADPARGRNIFNRTCLQCHRLFDSGGDVGPDLTGSDRANPSYILENVLDPSAAVAHEYTLTNIATTDGRLLSGIIREQNERSFTIQTANERIVLPREDVEALKPSSVSMMPEGQLERLTPQEIRDLFAYLASSKQVPLAGPK
jgi:putative heme-binding domain-containing protein